MKTQRDMMNAMLDKRIAKATMKLVLKKKPLVKKKATLKQKKK